MRCNTYFSLSAQSIDDGTELGRRHHYRRTLVNLFRGGSLSGHCGITGHTPGQTVLGCDAV
jgi:hypothetical protein